MKYRQQARPELDKDDSYIRPGLEDFDTHAPDPEADRLANLFRRAHVKSKEEKS